MFDIELELKNCYPSRCLLDLVAEVNLDMVPAVQSKNRPYLCVPGNVAHFFQEKKRKSEITRAKAPTKQGIIHAIRGPKKIDLC